MGNTTSPARKSGYSDFVQETLGVDLETALVVEELIRAEHPTLDHMTRRRLAAEARNGLALLHALDAYPDVLAFYRRQAGVTS